MFNPPLHIIDDWPTLTALLFCFGFAGWVTGKAIVFIITHYWEVTPWIITKSMRES